MDKQAIQEIKQAVFNVLDAKDISQKSVLREILYYLKIGEIEKAKERIEEELLNV